MAGAEPLVRIHRDGRAEPPDRAPERPAARDHRADGVGRRVPRPRRAGRPGTHLHARRRICRATTAVILLGHELWQSRLAGRGDIVGSTIDASGRKRTVVGIMPPGFTIEGQRADFYITYGWTDGTVARGDRPRALACGGPASRRCHADTGVRRHGRARGAAREGGAAAECGTIGHRPADPHAHGRDDQAGAPGPLRRRRPGAADRLRQRREPAAGAQHRSAA